MILKAYARSIPQCVAELIHAVQIRTKRKTFEKQDLSPLFDSSQVHISQQQMELIENIGAVILTQPLSEAQPKKTVF